MHRGGHGGQGRRAEPQRLPADRSGGDLLSPYEQIAVIIVVGMVLIIGFLVWALRQYRSMGGVNGRS